jgi:hypothetical protein
MQSRLHHWNADREIRLTIYVVCIVAILCSLGFALYILR